MRPHRQSAVPREIVALAALFALEAAVVFATYSRLPLRDLYHVSGTGRTGGLSRVVVFLNWPTALVALAVLPFVARGASPLAAAAAVLCFGLFWPGTVDQADLDAKWANAVPAAGVLLTGALVLWQVRRGVAAPRRLDGDVWRIGVGALLVLVALPWIAAELGLDLPGLGLFVTDEWWAPFGHARLEHAVHHGQHHGMVGTFCALTALVLSRALDDLGRRTRVAVAVWLGVLFTYGLAAILNDAWYEQLVKRGVTTAEVPAALLSAPNVPWLLILVGGGIAAWLFLRDAPTARPARRGLPRAVVAPVAAAALALVGL